MKTEFTKGQWLYCNHKSLESIARYVGRDEGYIIVTGEEYSFNDGVFKEYKESWYATILLQANGQK
jgi:hypothetical protein